MPPSRALEYFEQKKARLKQDCIIIAMSQVVEALEQKEFSFIEETFF